MNRGNRKVSVPFSGFAGSLKWSCLVVSSSGDEFDLQFQVSTHCDSSKNQLSIPCSLFDCVGMNILYQG